jgi:hypothetical protein
MRPALRRGDCRSGAGVRCGRRRLGFALTAASGESSSEPDHSPGSRPRRLGTRHRRPCRALTGADSSLHCHQRRHAAPGLRAGRNRSTREDGLRPCFMKTTDQPNGPASGRRRPEFPVSAWGRGALRRVRYSANLDERPDRPAPRTVHRSWRGRTCRRPAWRGYDELRRTRSPRWRRTGSPRSSPVPVDSIVALGVDVQRGMSARADRFLFAGACCSLWRYLRPCALRDGLVVGHP